MAPRKPKIDSTDIASDIVGGIRQIMSPWLGTPPGEYTSVTQGKALARSAANMLDQSFAGGMIGAGVKGPEALARQAAINAAGLGVGYGLGRGVSGVVKFAQSPTGQLIRNNIGQSDLVGQPIRTAILKAEVRQAIKANMGIQGMPVFPNTGSTQVRNMMDMYSKEITFFGDVAKKYSGMQKLINSPSTVAHKIDEAKDLLGRARSEGYSTTLYDKIKAEGLMDLPPVYMKSSSGKVQLADGHHRISSANDLDPRQKTRWIVNSNSSYANPWERPAFLTPGQKVKEAFTDAAENFRSSRAWREEKARVKAMAEPQASYNLFSPETKNFLNNVTSPTSRDLQSPRLQALQTTSQPFNFRTSQLPELSEIVNYNPFKVPLKPGAKAPSSNKSSKPK